MNHAPHDEPSHDEPAPGGPDESASCLLQTHGELVGIYKDAGRLVHNSQWAGPRETTMLDLAREALGISLWPLHRLDRGTSGLLLCVDDREQASAWNDAYRQPGVAKEYLAIVRGHIQAPLLIERPIPDDDGNPLDARSLMAPIAHSKRARVSLVRVHISTGRRHQIRRHMRSISHHVVGDATWGNNKFNKEMKAHEVPITRLALHSWRIALPTPQGERVTLHADPRGDFLQWCEALFELPPWEELRALPWLNEGEWPASSPAPSTGVPGLRAPQGPESEGEA